MATFDSANAVVSTAIDQGFIPQLWSDEVIAAYKANLVAANLIRKLNHNGKKGDTIYVPTPDRGSASDKTATNAVSLQAHPTDTRVTISIDKHKEYSRLIEDFADVQALSSLRRFYVDDASYAIARATDYDVIAELLGVSLSGTVFDATEPANTMIDQAVTVASNEIIDGAGAFVSAITNAATGYATVSDGGIRTAVRIFDTNDVPMSNRAWMVRPEVKEVLLGLPRFTEEAFVGEAARANSIRNGLVGDVYAMEVFVTNQLPTVEASDSENAANGYCSIFVHRDAAVHVEQMAMRSQRQYKQEFLADLLTTDTIYGVKRLRDTNIILMFSENP